MLEDTAIIWSMAETFLKEAQKLPKGRVPEFMAKPFEEITRTFLGFVGLLSPRPQALQSAAADVDWILDRTTLEQMGTISESSLRVKKSVVKRLKKGEFWKQMCNDYDEIAGAYAAHGQGVLKLEKDVLNLSQAWQDTAAEQNPKALEEAFGGILKSVAESISTWREDLRSGATVDLEVALLNLMRTVVGTRRGVLETSQDVDLRSAALNGLRAIDSVLPLLVAKGNTVSEFQQEVGGLLAAWAEKAKVAVLSQAVKGDLGVDGVAAQVHKAITGVQNIMKPKQLLEALAMFLPSLYVHMQQAAASHDMDSMAQQSEMLIRVLEALTNQQDFCDIVGGKQDFHKRAKLVKECVRATVKIRACSRALELSIDTDTENTLAPAMDKLIVAMEKRPSQIGEQVEDFSLDDPPPHYAAWRAAIDGITNSADQCIAAGRPIVERAANLLKASASDSMQASLDKCRGVMFGGQGGMFWHHGYNSESADESESDILQLFARTLGGSDVSFMEDCLMSCVQVVAIGPRAPGPFSIRGPTEALSRAHSSNAEGTCILTRHRKPRVLGWLGTVIRSGCQPLRLQKSFLRASADMPTSGCPAFRRRSGLPSGACTSAGNPTLQDARREARAVLALARRWRGRWRALAADLPGDCGFAHRQVGVLVGEHACQVHEGQWGTSQGVTCLHAQRRNMWILRAVASAHTCHPVGLAYAHDINAMARSQLELGACAGQRPALQSIMSQFLRAFAPLPAVAGRPRNGRRTSQASSTATQRT